LLLLLCCSLLFLFLLPFFCSFSPCCPSLCLAPSLQPPELALKLQPLVSGQLGRQKGSLGVALGPGDRHLESTGREACVMAGRDEW
jgi:hypothetical protein